MWNLSASFTLVDKQKLIQFNMRDITQHKIVEEELSQASARDSAISILAFKLVSSISISDISRLILECAERFTGSTCGLIGYFDLGSGFMVSPPMTDGMWAFAESKEKTDIFKKFEGSWGWVLNNRQSLLTNSPNDDPRFSQTAIGCLPLHNFLSAPALIVQDLVGQVVLANSNRNFDQRDLEFVQRLAALYAIAIQHHRKDEKIRKLAYQDPLTGLPNRALFNDRFSFSPGQGQTLPPENRPDGAGYR